MKIPETVIIDAQKQVYLHKDEWLKSRATLEAKLKELEVAENAVSYRLKCLVDTLEFLEAFNSDCYDDWFAELGVSEHRRQNKPKK